MPKTKKTPRPTPADMNGTRAPVNAERAAGRMQVLMPLCTCPLCRAYAIVELTPAQRLAQPDDTTHVCHPALGGCNHGFTDGRTRV